MEELEDSIEVFLLKLLCTADEEMELVREASASSGLDGSSNISISDRFEPKYSSCTLAKNVALGGLASTELTTTQDITKKKN